MNLGQSLSSLFAGLREHHRYRVEQSLPAEIVDCAIERIIDGTDEHIRLARAYRKHLSRVVGQALEYTQSLSEQLPPPLPLNKDSFASNPYANACFVNADELQLAIHRSFEARSFYQSPDHRKSECYALLCMRKTERKILGSALIDGRLVRDMPQTTVSFSDHHLYSPSASESQARLELRCCFFEGLIESALARISRYRADRQRLTIKQRRLTAYLRSEHDPTRKQALQATLAETTQRLDGTPFATPEVCLEQVIEVFSAPDHCVQLSHLQLDVDRTGIKADSDSARPVNHLQLTEARINQQPPRVVMLVRFRQDDLLH